MKNLFLVFLNVFAAIAESKYSFLWRVNRGIKFGISLILVVSMAFPPLAEMIGLDSMGHLIIIATLLGGCVLLDRKLERLMTVEAFEATANIDLDAVADVVYADEKQRRRREGKSL